MNSRLFAVAALACCLSSVPAHAVDDPALPDGGCFVRNPDAGAVYALDTYRTGSWNMAVLCDSDTRYKMCESNNALIATTQDGGVLSADGGVLYDGGQYQSQGTCSVSSVNQFLAAGRIFDIAVPADRRFFAAATADGGALNCCLQIVTP